MVYDVAIIGGGPAGATVGTLLKKYAPQLNVIILEKEAFPREHVGESQLPLVSVILDEMECWDKVEAAGFPIKIGATYTWGRDPEPWHFNFVPPEQFKGESRPAKFEGQRPKEHQNTDEIAKRTDHIQQSLKFSDHLPEKGWMVNDTFGLADISMSVGLAMLQGMMGYNLADWPKAQAFLGRAMERPSWQKIMVELKPILAQMQSKS